MAEVKDVMNDLYLAYKQYRAAGNLKEWNQKIGEFTKKYAGDPFYEDVAWAFTRQISRELGL